MANLLLLLTSSSFLMHKVAHQAGENPARAAIILRIIIRICLLRSNEARFTCVLFNQFKNNNNYSTTYKISEA